MNALLAALSVILFSAIALAVRGGPQAALLCVLVTLLAGTVITRVEEQQRAFLLRILVSGLLIRVLIGTLIFVANGQDFFGGDALTYDQFGGAVLDAWRAGVPQPTEVSDWARAGGGWGMLYFVAGIYGIVGHNMLAVQFINSVIGAATAPVIFLCARHIFQNLRVAKLAAFCVAFFPSLVLWSSQGLKDGPIVFLLTVTMLATLKLGERLRWKYIILLVLSMFAVLSMRFYVFYMVTAAVVGAFLIGMRPITSQSLARQLVVVLAIGLGLTYLGVLRTATAQFERFGDLSAVQRSRADLVRSANSSFGQDVDVSTASGALTAIPTGFVYLMFAPFPWQVANLRQSITLPEMMAWWGAFPLLIIGTWFTIKYRFRQALPILIFTTMLTLAYSIFQGNVGTAYRQRSQILVFYFIFVAVGAILLKERQEDRRRATEMARQESREAARTAAARQRYERWKTEREHELEDMAQSISQRIDF
jgi:hypothetical protein